MKRTLISLILTVIMIITTSGLASATDSWKYYFPIAVSDNTGATRTMYPIILEVGGDSLVDGGYLTANGTDARLRTTADKNLLMSTTNITFVVDSLPAYGQVTYDLYTGYSPEKSDYQVIVGDEGYITVADNTTIELGDNFTEEQSGWWDTTYSVNKTAVYKEDAFQTYISGTENITSVIWGWISPTGYNDPSSDWSFETLTFDNDTGTFGYETVPPVGGSWGQFLEWTFPSMTVVDVRLWQTATGMDKIDIDLYYDDAWHAGYEDAQGASGEWVIHDVADGEDVTQARIRYHHDGGAPPSDCDTYEFNLRGWAYPVTASDVSSGKHTVTTTQEEALNFDFVDDNVDVDTVIGDLIGGVGTGTIEFWIYSEDSDNTTNVIFYGGMETGTTSFLSFEISNGLLRAIAEYKGVTYWDLDTNAQIDDFRKFVFVTLVQDGVEPVLYIDDSPPAQAFSVSTDKTFWFPDMSDRLDNARIGCKRLIANSYFFDGIITQGRVYDGRALTPAEVAEHNQGIYSDETGLIAKWDMNEGSGATITDSSGNSNDGTIVSATWIRHTLRLYVDDNFKDIGSGLTVPDNANDWTFLQNNVMSYADNITFTINGTRELWFEPNAMITGTTLPDRATSVANDGTITWGSNDGVEIVFGSVTSYEATTSAATVNTTGFVLPLVGIPDNWWGMEFDGEDLPFYPTFLDTSTQTGIPLQTLYLLVVFGVAIALATVTIVLTRSVVVGVAFYTVTMSYGANAGIVAWWIIYVFLIMVIGIIFLSSRQAMGG